MHACVGRILLVGIMCVDFNVLTKDEWVRLVEGEKREREETVTEKEEGRERGGDRQTLKDRRDVMKNLYIA